jgi:hypothetical protein
MTPMAGSDTSAHALYDLIGAHRITAMIYVTARLRIADFLADGPLTPRELATKSGADERSLRRLLRALVSAGIDFAMTQLDRTPYEAGRRVIDISGDGDNNSGRDVTEARDETIAKGVTINGLAILTETTIRWNSDHTNPPGGLANYYRNNVIGGPGAFVMVAENFNSFGDVVVKKLITEIARAEPRQRAGDEDKQLCLMGRGEGVGFAKCARWGSER